MRLFFFHLIFGFLFSFFYLHAEPITLDLQSAIIEAEKSSPQIQKIDSMKAEASWKKIETYSFHLPSLSLSADYLLQKKFMSIDFKLPGSPAPLSIDQIMPTSNLSLNLNFPLFDGLRSTNRTRAAMDFEESAECEKNWAHFQIEQEVTAQFYRTLSAKILGDVAKQNLKTLEEHLENIRQFKKAGVSTRYDVLRVEVQTSEAKSEVLNTTYNYEMAQEKLMELLGTTQNGELILKGELPTPATNIVDNLKSEDIVQRNDIQALIKREEGSHRMETAAASFWVPTVSLFAQSRYYNNRTDDLFGKSAYRHASLVGVSLLWNIFDGMGSIARSKQSVEQRFQAGKSLEIARLKAKGDFENAKRKFLYFSAVHRSRLSDIQKAEESVRLAREGHRVGQRTNSDLLDAMSELFRAKAQAVTAQLGLLESLLNLESSVGKKISKL